MTQVFYWNPAAPTSGKARLTRGEVKAVFDADDVRHLASAAGGDTWLIERRGKQSVVKIPTGDYKLSWVDRADQCGVTHAHRPTPTSASAW